MRLRVPRRSRAAFLLALPLAACASGGGPKGPINDANAAAPTTTRIEGMAGTSEVRTFASEVATASSPVAAPAAKTFASLPTVYDALGVPVNTVQTDAGIFGARDTRMPRRLAKVALSQYVDCGTNATGAPNADTYAVTMSVLSRVAADPGGAASNVTTQLTATARPITVSGNTVQCASTGRLEDAINKRLAAEAVR